MFKDIFGKKNNIAPFEIAGVTLGGFTPEVEGVMTLGILGDYAVQSFNNSSGTTSYVHLLPVDSAEEPRWLTEKQVADLYRFLEGELGGIFGEAQVIEDEKVEYVSFEVNDCAVLLFFIEDDGFMIRPEVQIRHIDAFNQIQREISTFPSYDDWFDKRIIR